MMKNILCILFCAVLLLSLCACGDESAGGTGNEVVFDADLTLDVLEDILLKKGDALLATDIPENYTYVFQPVGAVPQIIYPIDETMSFSLIPISEGKNMMTLSVKNDEGSLDYVGAEDILEFIRSRGE